MKQIIILLIINIITIPLIAQNDNLFSGVGVGYNVGNSTDYNTAFGDSAFFEVTNYIDGISAFGAFAGYNASRYATAIGYKAGGAIDYSLAIGVNSSGFLGEVGFGVTIGHNTGVSLTSNGSYNILIGEEAGYSLTDKDYVIVIGHRSATNLDVEANTIIGHDIGNNITSEGNTIIGNATEDYGSGGAGYSLTSGEYNVLLGTSTGSSLTTSSYNTFVGAAAGGLTETAEPNTFVGGLSGYNTGKNGTTTTANYNTFVGYKSGYTNEGGLYNTIIGSNADVANANLDYLVQVGANSAAHADGVTLIGYNGVGEGAYSIGIGSEVTVSGEYGIGIGYQSTISTAGENSVNVGYQSSMTESESIGIGYLSDVQGATSVAIGSDVEATGTNATILGATNTVNGSNSMAIGHNISIANDNQINIGNDAVMSISGIVNWTTTSDGRLKNNVQEDIPGLDFILKLRPVTYELRVASYELRVANQSQNETLNPQLVTRFTGFIAQEVEQVAQSIDYDFSGIDAPKNEEDRYGLRYGQFVVPLVKATQELSGTIQNTEQAVSQTKKQVEGIDILLNKIEAKLSELED